MDKAEEINDQLPPKGTYGELPTEERDIFLTEVGELCNKSLTIYSFLIDQIHKHKLPEIVSATGVHSSITLEGKKVVYEKKENEENT